MSALGYHKKANLYKSRKVCQVVDVGDSAAVSISAANVLNNNVIHGAASAGSAWTLPTASAVVGAMPSKQVNSCFSFQAINTTTNAATISGGAGNSLLHATGGNVLNDGSISVTGVVTSVSTPAVTYYFS